MTTTTRFALATAALLLVGACSDDQGSAPSTTAPPTTAAPTTAPPTTAPPTTAPPTTVGALAALPNGPLETGATYRVARVALGRAVQVTNTVDGAFAINGRGGFALTSDQLGTELLVGVVDLATATVLDDPLADANTFDPGAGGTSPAPTDVFAYLSTLPGMEIGEPVDTTFAGHPASMATWKVGTFEGGHPCFGSDRGNCVLTFFLPAGWLSTYWSGDAGTTYVLDIDGQVIVVEVQDRPGAKEIAESIVIGD